MPLAEQITKNLIDPDKHGPFLKAVIDVLEEEGEKGLKDLIKRWVQEIVDENPDFGEHEEV